jgi:hypothetical protein
MILFVVVNREWLAHIFHKLHIVNLMSSFWFLLLQIGNRKALYDAVSVAWNDCSFVMKTNVSARSSLLKKFLVKLAQRIALISLPPRSPSWQYKVLNLILLHSCSI